MQLEEYIEAFEFERKEFHEALDDLAKMKAERDEARQMYCNAMTDHCEEHEARQIAKEQGWDCFGEKD
jgi:hypothetical protein